MLTSGIHVLSDYVKTRTQSGNNILFYLVYFLWQIAVLRSFKHLTALLVIAKQPAAQNCVVSDALNLHL